MARRWPLSTMRQAGGGPPVGWLSPRSGEEGGGGGDGALGCGQADADHRLRGEGVQALQAQRQVGAALGTEDGVDLVHDHGARGGQHAAASGAGEQQVERLRRGHHDVRRSPGHGGADGSRRIAGTQAGADLRRLDPAGVLQQRADALQRSLQVALDVVAESLQRRYVDDPGLVRQGTRGGLPHQLVDSAQERRQRLAGAGRRRDQGVAGGLDGRPGFVLRRRRGGKGAAKPGRHGGMEQVQRVSIHGAKKRTPTAASGHRSPRRQVSDGAGPNGLPPRTRRRHTPCSTFPPGSDSASGPRSR